MTVDQNVKFDVSVIIPTLGRPTLKGVIDQIMSDKGSTRLEILVVADGNEALRKVHELNFCLEDVTILLNNRTSGVSGSLNTGLIHASAKYLMFFSDDDDWKPGKFAKCLSNIERKENACFFSQVEIIDNRGNSTIRPIKITADPINPLLYLYQTNPALRNPAYLSLTSFIAPIGATECLFPEVLKSREDIAWLHSLYESGLDIFITEGVCARVNIGYARTVDRDNSHELGSWLDWLQANYPSVQANFLYCHFLRPFVVSGMIFKGVNILRKAQIWKIKPNTPQLKTLMFLLTLGFIKFYSRSIFNNNVIKSISKLSFFIRLQIQPHRK
jgi:glycosyltransferase involved in cell wall biosynthesis